MTAWAFDVVRPGNDQSSLDWMQGERLDRWDAALGNAADAQVALDVIERAIDDAVYLGEDAFNQLLPTQAYTRTIQVRVVALLRHARENLDKAGNRSEHH